MNKWQRISSRTLFENSYFRLIEDNIIRPDGQAGTYAWIESPPSVMIIALDKRDKLAIVKQNRFMINNETWEIPGGSTDGHDPLEMAKKELAEEAGYMAEHWHLLPQQTNPFIGRTPEYTLHYIAQGLHQMPTSVIHSSDDPDETKFVTWHEAVKLIKNGTITNGQSISALMLAGIHLGHIK